MPVFTKELVKSYRNSMFKEMEDVAHKYGVDIDFGNIRYQSDEFRVQMTVTDPTARRGKEIIASRGTEGIKIGSYIKHPARRHLLQITEITSDRKYVIVRSLRGVSYRIKMEDAMSYAA